MSLSVSDIVPCVAFCFHGYIAQQKKTKQNCCCQTRFLGSKCTQNAFSAAGGADSDMAVIAMEDQYELVCIVTNDLG